MIYLRITVRIYNVFKYILIIDIKMLFASNETKVAVNSMLVACRNDVILLRYHSTGAAIKSINWTYSQRRA